MARLKNGSFVRLYQLFPTDQPSTPAPKAALLNLPYAGWIASLALSPNQGTLLFVFSQSQHRSEVMRLDVRGNGTAKSLLVGGGISHIAYDWAAGNVYYAVDGVGIGVCSEDGMYCRQLFTVWQVNGSEPAQKYLSLLTYPKRGMLIWLEVNNEHPMGVVFASGMDGNKVRFGGRWLWLRLVETFE